MRRKLIPQGLSGLTIYLPKKWVDRHGLKAGGEVSIEEEKQGLFIESQSIPSKKEAIVSFTSNDPRFLRLVLTNYYRAGYDKIVLKGNILESEVYPVLHRLIGFEITQSKNKEVIIESMMASSEDNFETLMKQLFFIVKQDLEDLITAVKAVKKIDVEKVSVSSERALRNSSFCMRLVSQKRHEFDGFLWNTITLLAWISRQLYFLADELKDKKPAQLNNKQISYLEEIKSSFNDLYEGFYSKSRVNFEKVHAHYLSYEHEKFKLLQNKDVYTTIVMYHFSIIDQLVRRAASSALGTLMLAEAINP
ncbi:MAG: hypothetical protein AABX70_06545 [Nanoarchaeota archaeon]